MVSSGNTGGNPGVLQMSDFVGKTYKVNDETIKINSDGTFDVKR